MDVLIPLALLFPIPFLPILLVKLCIDAYKRSGFFGKRKFYVYLLPILSLALQGGVIYLLAIGELAFNSFFYFIVGWAIILLIVYGPFVGYFSIVSDGFDDIGKLGVGDWLIVFLHLPLFLILLILLVLGFIGKEALKSSPSSSGGGAKTSEDKKYHIETEYGTHYVKDEYGNTIDTASVDFSGQGDFKGSDGSIYKKKD